MARARISLDVEAGVMAQLAGEVPLMAKPVFPGVRIVARLRLAAVAATATLITPSPALAGADATFDQAFDMFEGMLIGSGGKVLALIALAVAIFAMVRGQFGVKEVVLPVGIGIAVTAGVGIVTSTITATI